MKRETDLQLSGLSTKLAVNVVELDLLNMEKDLENIYGELYITLLQVATISGFNVEDFI